MNHKHQVLSLLAAFHICWKCWSKGNCASGSTRSIGNNRKDDRQQNLCHPWLVTLLGGMLCFFNSSPNFLAQKYSETESLLATCMRLISCCKGITHRCNKQFGFQILWILIWKHISSSRKVMNLLFWKQKVEGLTDLQYDNLLDFQDPHLVGVAIKKPAVSASESSDARDKLTKKKRKSQPAVKTA